MRNPNVSLKTRRSMRLPGYDYRQAGVYFVTLCTYQMTKLFGAVFDGEMVLSDLGKVVREEWQHAAQARSKFQLDLFVIMPNHFHGLVIIEDRRDCSAVQNDPADLAMRTSTLSAGSLGANISQFKAAVSRRAWSGTIDRDQRIWQRNYYDHIVRNEESLNDIRRYILENPTRWHEDSMYVE